VKRRPPRLFIHRRPDLTVEPQMLGPTLLVVP
jgi:hypothetical protein